MTKTTNYENSLADTASRLLVKLIEEKIIEDNNEPS